MATLRRESGQVVTDRSAIAELLAPLGIEVARWPVEGSTASTLLEQPWLDDAGKEQALQAFDTHFEQLRKTAGYQSRDMVVLHPETPGLDGALAKLDRWHTHSDDEVRFIVDGEGVFGFVLPDGEQVELTVEAGDDINVPAETEHWFELTDTRRIKAIRYFVDTAGWAPHYTDRPRERKA